MRRLKCHFQSANARFWRKNGAGLFSLALVLCAQSAAQGADIDRWKEFLQGGEEAYQKHRWSKAEHFFSKAVREADRSDVGDKNLALSLRKLGEANTAAHKYREAEAHLQRAIKVAKDCGADDPEAIRDLLELAKTYRSVNLEQFGKNVATILKETGLDSIEIMNTKGDNSRVVVRFADKFNKHVNSTDVNEINLEKRLTFDIHEDKDGTITLTNIKGLRIHSKIWVNLTESSIDPHGDDGKPTALVTAEKLGLTKTVKTVLPKPVYDKILTVVERIRHPELHSPWHKQLQERISTSTKAKPLVPVTITNTTSDSGSGPSKNPDTAAGSTTSAAVDDSTTTQDKTSTTATDKTAATSKTPPTNSGARSTIRIDGLVPSGGPSDIGSGVESGSGSNIDTSGNRSTAEPPNRQFAAGDGPAKNADSNNNLSPPKY